MTDQERIDLANKIQSALNTLSEITDAGDVEEHILSAEQALRKAYRKVR